MPRNQWLAIDKATAPAVRAGELRQQWEQFVSGAQVGGVRSPVADSWRRSLHAGVDPLGSRLAPVAADRAEALERWAGHPLGEAAPLIRDCLESIADESDHLIVVSDAAGMLLQLEGNALVRSRAADSMNFTEGALWSERGAGTNAIGTALAADHAVQIFATEHFVEPVQAWTCSAAPVHDPETGELIGVIDLTGLEKDVNPHSLAVAITTARAVEGLLRYRLGERDDRLLARHEWRLSGARERRALVALSGRPIADDRRGWLHGQRVELPPEGGEVLLPSGRPGFAELVGDEEAFLVRELPAAFAPRRTAGDELRALADEQAALRRLATAGARGAAPSDIFTAAAEEIAFLFGADDAAIVRFEPDGTGTIVAGLGKRMAERGSDVRVELDDSLAVTAVFRTGRPARAGNCAVASPIIVDGRLWGAMVASTDREPLPADTEERIANFTELVGIVIANAESRAELTASRARVVTAADEARRRIQRDLHDGAQARLVSTVVTLKLAREELGDATGPVVELLDEALGHAESANGELRELAHGILPAALSRGGLRAGIDALVSRVHLTVSVDVTAERLPAALEAAAYFILAEALTNVVRHAHATSARIVAVRDADVLRLEVRDDGIGGAPTDGSSGLFALRDRAAAMDGELRVASPLGQGTAVAAMLPIPVSEAA